MKPAIRLQIEHIRDTGGRETLHLDYQEIPRGMTRERAVRFMLQEAAEKFLDKPHEATRVD